MVSPKHREVLAVAQCLQNTIVLPHELYASHFQHQSRVYERFVTHCFFDAFIFFMISYCLFALNIFQACGVHP